MLFMGLGRGYVPSHVRQKKNALPRRSEVWLPNKPGCGPQGWGAENARTRRGRTRLLHVDEEVALEDVLPFLVLLGLFVRLVIFPAEYGAALATIDVTDGVVSRSHLTVIRFAFDNVNPARIHPLVTTQHDRASNRSYTSSNK